MRTELRTVLVLAGMILGPTLVQADGTVRTMRFQAKTPGEARRWQHTARERLFALMMGGAEPARVPLEPRVLRRIEVRAGGYVVEELSLQTLPDRRAHAWLATPLHRSGKVGAVLALHGHGGTGEQVVRGLSLYWYGRALAEMGYAVMAPDIGQHDLQHTNWTLMGERVWDSLRCVDYLETRPEIDTAKLAVAGLSLGGETTMYVAALDERLNAADSSGWLTTVENMKNGHCPCWNSPGLEENFDFADVFACIAPRPLVCELGEKEKAPGGFPVAIGRSAFEEIRAAYRVLNAEAEARLTVHPEGHVFKGFEFWPLVHAGLGAAYPWLKDKALSTESLLRRGEIARRCFSRAHALFEGWWDLRDQQTGLFPRRVDQPVWAPNDNAADMLPFLAITTRITDPTRFEEVLETIPRERTLTARVGVMPDWLALTNRAFLYPNIDMNRLVFCAAEYCKDGFLPMTEAMGRGAWTERLLELVDAIFEHAPVSSDFGNLPANDTEVNGEILQVLSRLYFMTRNPKYLGWAERIGDAYCLEVLPGTGGIPAWQWDFVQHRPIRDEFSLNDHGNELVGGLSELYMAAHHGNPPKAAKYGQSLRTMIERLLEKARNSDGLWVQRVRATTGEVLDASTPDTWGYALNGVATLGPVLNHPSWLEAVRTALTNLDQPRYLDWNGADSYADSIEGGLVLLNRFPVGRGFDWLESVLPIFLGKQRDDGIVEGWYGDGNYARTALMAALYYTQGLRCQPWKPYLRYGAAQNDRELRVAMLSESDWEGRLIFDTPRHRTHLNLPANYPRLNEFPEWFAVQHDAEYKLDFGEGNDEVKTGAQLAQGVFVKLTASQTLTLKVRQK